MKQNKLLGIKINCTAHSLPPRSMYEYAYTTTFQYVYSSKTGIVGDISIYSTQNLSIDIVVAEIKFVTN